MSGDNKWLGHNNMTEKGIGFSGTSLTTAKPGFHQKKITWLLIGY